MKTINVQCLNCGRVHKIKKHKTTICLCGIRWDVIKNKSEIKLEKAINQQNILIRRM